MPARSVAISAWFSARISGPPSGDSSTIISQLLLLARLLIVRNPLPVPVNTTLSTVCVQDRSKVSLLLSSDILVSVGFVRRSAATPSSISTTFSSVYPVTLSPVSLKSLMTYLSVSADLNVSYVSSLLLCIVSVSAITISRLSFSPSAVAVMQDVLLWLYSTVFVVGVLPIVVVISCAQLIVYVPW